ncbi:MAG: hypothetical protein WAU68_06475 [Vitreimonas sp.]
MAAVSVFERSASPPLTPSALREIVSVSRAPLTFDSGLSSTFMPAVIPPEEELVMAKKAKKAKKAAPKKAKRK